MGGFGSKLKGTKSLSQAQGIDLNPSNLLRKEAVKFSNKNQSEDSFRIPVQKG
jgi:hypothetical protein